VPTSAQVQVLVDDRPVGGVSTQFTDLSQIPAENIERIEIVRGGSSVLYGANTIGGVIHVITKRHRDEERARSSIGWETGSFKTHIYRADLGAKARGFDGYVNASRYFTNGFQQNADGDNFSAAGNGGYSFDNGARVSLDLSRADHEIGDPQGTTVPISQWDGSREHFAANPSQRVEQKYTTARLQASWPLGTAVNVQSAFYGSHQDYQIFPSRVAPVSFDQDIRIVGNDTRFFLPGGFTLGGAYERDEQDILTSGFAAHITNWSVYAQETLNMGDATLIPAVRLDQHSAFGNVVNPRFTAVYRFSEDVKVSANAARSFRAPTLSNLYADFPDTDGIAPDFSFYANRNLRPETAWTYDLGFRTRTPDSIDSELSVTGFYTRLRERITPADTNGDGISDTNVNAPRAEMSGVETELSAKWGPLTEKMNYAYQRAVGDAAGFSGFVPLRLTPQHMANCELIWDLPKRWSVSGSLQYVHKQYELDNEMGIKLPSYTLWHARLSKKILGAELYFGVENITDIRYAEAFSTHPTTFATTIYPQPGRTFWGGMTIRFADKVGGPRPAFFREKEERY
jgi:outer membrane receptor protein involved in Fe transport